MNKRFFAGLIIAMQFTSAVASADEALSSGTPSTVPARAAKPAPACRNWKDTERFAISNVAGLQDQYLTDETIEFSVEGASDQMAVTRENGFYLAASLVSPPDHVAYGARTTYEAGNNGWKVQVKNLFATGKECEMQIRLLCGGKTTPCATTFGEGTWVEVTRPVHVN